MRKNVHFGLGNTLKGYNHTYEHNTGNNLNVVWQWKVIVDHNEQSYIRYNAYTGIKSRGSKYPKNAIPGYSAINACNDLDVCNNNPSLENSKIVDAELSEQIRAMSDVNDICAELRNCWTSAGGEEQGDVLDDGSQDGFVVGDSISNYHPWQVPTPTLKDKAHDFRPKENSRLVLNWNGNRGASSNGMVIAPKSIIYQVESDANSLDGYKVTMNRPDPRELPATFDSYMGAYSPNEPLWVPGTTYSGGLNVQHMPLIWRTTCSRHSHRTTPEGPCICDRGYKHKHHDQTQGGMCEPCPAGTFNAVAGQDDCTQCGTGRSSTAASKEEIDCKCNAGMTIPPSSTTCSSCSKGTYKEMIGNQQCESCPESFTSPEGSTKLADCDCAAGLSEIEPVVKVLYLEGPVATPINSRLTGSLSVVKGATYSVQMEVLRCGLKQARNKVADIKFDGKSVGVCNPPVGSLYGRECTFFDCMNGCAGTCGNPRHPHTIPSDLKVTAQSNKIDVSMTFTRHASACKCKMDPWKCVDRNAVATDDHKLMSAVVRLTLQPVSTEAFPVDSLGGDSPKFCTVK